LVHVGRTGGEGSHARNSHCHGVYRKSNRDRSCREPQPAGAGTSPAWPGSGLYQDNILTKPKNYAYAFPDLLTFHDAPTVIEQKLFVMFLEHRMRTFQGTFHASPDYALWYGWSEMQRDLSEIKELAESMRRGHASASPPPRR